MWTCGEKQEKTVQNKQTSQQCHIASTLRSSRKSGFQLGTADTLQTAAGSLSLLHTAIPHGMEASALGGRKTKWLCHKVHNSIMQVSWEFGCQRKNYSFLFQPALPSLFYFCLGPLLSLRDKQNTSLSALKTVVEDADVRLCFSGKRSRREGWKEKPAWHRNETFPCFS